MTFSVDTTGDRADRFPNAVDVPGVSFSLSPPRPGDSARRSRVDRDRRGKPAAVATVRRATAAGADAVWAVLADDRLLGAWVVGAARVDAVDATWPAVGARLRYRIGAWPVLLPGVAEVTACAAGRELALHGRTPFGGVDVRLTLTASGAGTELAIAEDVVSGPARLVPARLRAAGIAARNVETLRRLALLAEAAPAS